MCDQFYRSGELTDYYVRHVSFFSTFGCSREQQVRQPLKMTRHHFRFFLIKWHRRNSCFNCAGSRAYDSICEHQIRNRFDFFIPSADKTVSMMTSRNLALKSVISCHQIPVGNCFIYFSLSKWIETVLTTHR